LSKALGELTCKRFSDAFGLRTICLRINANWYFDRSGVDVAVRSGWNRGRTVEEQWTGYRRSVEDPAVNVKNLWAVTDARDAAVAFRLALENGKIVHDVFLINADDVCSTVPSSELVSRSYPGVPVSVPLDGFAPLFSHDKGIRLLGYRPRFAWQASDLRDWLETA
jgi:UDP-glucose 4-epimerase